jgi:hypothetical protein
VGLAPTGKRRLFTAHADSGRSPDDGQPSQVDPLRSLAGVGRDAGPRT